MCWVIHGCADAWIGPATWARENSLLLKLLFHWSRTEKRDQILCSYLSKSDLENSEGVCLRIFFKGTMEVVVENEEEEEAPLYIIVWCWSFLTWNCMLSPHRGGGEEN